MVLTINKKSFISSMSSWDVARLTAHLGDYDIRTQTETMHVTRKIKRLVRHKGFDSRTLVSVFLGEFHFK